VQKRFVDIGPAFGADGEPAKSVQPRPGAFHHPSVPAQALAGLDLAAGDRTLKAAPSKVSAAATRSVSLLGVELLWASARTTAAAFDGWDGFRKGSNTSPSC
jgi:hypothetical protein